MDFFENKYFPKPKRNWILILNLIVAVALGSLCLILEMSAKPPVFTYDQARKAIGYARRTQANLYAPDLLRNAELYLEQARLAWASENDRWMVNRNFQYTQNYAVKAMEVSEKAAMRARAVRDSLLWLAQTGIELMKKQINQVRPQMIEMPLESRLRQKMAFGELLIMESEEAFKRGDYRRAVACYRTAYAKIGSAGDEVEETLAGYFANSPKWRKWVQETLNWSVQNNEYIILIDKLAHSCFVFQNGNKLIEFEIELGPNWLGHKRERGDGATPEGRYRICKKKSDRQTKYYKALEIDYPNEEDIAMFYNAKKRGDISASAGIGGLIEIHGDGGKGANWTAGCVALQNCDMDKLFEIAQIGTPVTIVGSLRGIPLQTQFVQTNNIIAQ